jgi:HSP20 family molecular chaperone IbpA
MNEDDLFKDAMNMKKRFDKARENLKDRQEVPGAPKILTAKPHQKKIIYETENSLIIALRIPWAKKENVKVAYDLKRIEIKVENSSKKFHKMLKLPCYVIPGKGKATFTADILRIELLKYKETTTKMNIEG